MITTTIAPARVPTRARFTVEQFVRIYEQEILDPERRYELIEGQIFEMPPIGPGHAGGVTYFTALLVIRLADRALVSVQGPIRIGDRSLPQPDLAVLRFRPSEYRDRYPTPDDVYLLIEVADSSLRFDRGLKQRLYARSGIPEYWIVNLRRNVVEVFREPGADGYQSQAIAQPGETLTLVALPDVSFAVAEILGVDR